jgi:hypothetical protein
MKSYTDFLISTNAEIMPPLEACQEHRELKARAEKCGPDRCFMQEIALNIDEYAAQ